MQNVSIVITMDILLVIVQINVSNAVIEDIGAWNVQIQAVRDDFQDNNISYV